ncbi:MAG: zinc-ribbon domain-containing protein [Patescibacteria group bacterium]|nr:zinc-ribbon domain-containing protein [Patescibacteria group bacterium]
MFCPNCGTKIREDDKFCKKCGKSVKMEKTKSPSNIDVEKIKKSLKNTGNSVYAIGWLTIILNIGIYLWSVLDKNFGESGLPASDLSGTFLIVVVASIFIIFGNRIRGLVDRNINLYLQILLGLSLLLLVWVLSMGGRVGILFFLIVAYLISSLVKIRKAMKSEKFTSTLTNPKYKLDKKGWIFFSIATVLLFFVAIGIDLSSPVYQGTNDSLSQVSNDNYSKVDLINETVREIKAEMTLPSQLDEVTKLVDISAQPNAIRYHYILSGVDASSLSNAYLKNFLISDICGNADTKNLLDYEINMEYSYTVDTGERYFITFTKYDCQ